MGKASRQRRQKKEHDRQRQRAAQAGGRQHEQPHVAPARDQVAVLITKALDARADQPQAYTRHVDQLSSDLGAGWPEMVSRTLVEFLRVSVAAAWRIGWQPAELARHVGRETSAVHASMAADMIAGEMRGYPSATVDPRWAAQVTGLSAVSVWARQAGAKAGASWDGSWWGSDERYLGTWRAALGELDPTVGVATALDTLHVLLHLRALEKLLPLPGGPGRGRVALHLPAGSGQCRDDPGGGQEGRVRAVTDALVPAIIPGPLRDPDRRAARRGHRAR